MTPKKIKIFFKKNLRRGEEVQDDLGSIVVHQIFLDPDDLGLLKILSPGDNVMCLNRDKYGQILSPDNR